MKKGFAIEIRQDPETLKAYRLVAEWEERTARVMKHLPVLVADYTRKEMLELIPKGEEWSAYRRSLEVARISGMPVGTAGVVLHANMRSRQVRRVDVPRTVLYIRSTRKLRRVKPEITILERFSPWTLQTLPFMPKRGEALVVSRRVSKREVEQVEKDRLKDRTKWRRELDRAGVKEVKKDRQLQIPKKVRALPDVAFEALRLEFGLGNVKQKAHWRPALRRLKSGGIKSMIRLNRKLRLAFTDLDFRGWKRWPKKTRNKVRMSEARNYLPFQKKLGIRR